MLILFLTDGHMSIGGGHISGKNFVFKTNIISSGPKNPQIGFSFEKTKIS